MEDEPLIEPSSFDVIVLGAGIVEAILAGAAAAAGRSVLLADSSSTYGGELTSTSLASFAALGGRLAGGQEGVPPRPDELPETPPLCFTRPGAQPLASPQGSYTLDLCPKALYQGEALVALLLSARAHHYVEFKLLEGCYMLSPTAATATAGPAGGGAPRALRRLPVSKSDIFRDRSLALGEKRALMKLLGRCLELEAGQGSSSSSSSSGSEAAPIPPPGQPMAQVLAQQGLSPALQDMVLYGVAMCDHNQQQQAPALQPEPGPEAGPEAGPGSGAERTGSGSGDAGPAVSAWSSHSALTTVMGAAQGQAAMSLFLQSMNRFGGPGAFMVPSHGSASLAEAFVRFAAVRGAATVLRLRLAGVRQLQQSEAEAKERQRVEVRTAGGQALRCGTLVAAAGYLEPLLQQRPAARRWSRAVAVTGASLVQGESVLSVVLPPGCLQPAAGQPQPHHAVRALQVGAATHVAPAGRHLLHFATPGCSSHDSGWQAAYEDLQVSVSALLDTGGLQSSDGGGGAGGLAHSCSSEAAAAGERPAALQVYYYSSYEPGPIDSSRLPEGIACSTVGDASMVGLRLAAAHSERLFRSLFPADPWLGDAPPQARASDQSEEGGPDEEDGAVEDLRSALGSLRGQVDE